MPNKIKRFFISQFLVGIVLVLVLPRLSGQEVPYIHFKTGVDFPGSTVYSNIIELSNGEMLFFTESGVISYDGIAFEEVNNELLSNREIIHAVYFADDQIRLGDLEGNVLNYDAANDQVTLFENVPTSRYLHPQFDLQNPNYLYYISTTDSVKHWYQYDLVHSAVVAQDSFFSSKESLPIDELNYALFFKSQSNVNSRFLAFPEHGDLPSTRQYVEDELCPCFQWSYLDHGAAFIHMKDRQQVQFIEKQDRHSKLSPPIVLPSTSEHCISFDAGDHFGVISDRGVLIVDTVEYKLLSLSSKWNQMIFHQAMTTQRGQVWLGTQGHGLIFIPDLTALHYTSENSFLRHDNIKFVGRGRDSSEVLISNSNGDWHIMRDGRFYKSFDGPGINIYKVAPLMIETDHLQKVSSMDEHIDINYLKLTLFEDMLYGVVYGGTKWFVQLEDYDLFFARKAFIKLNLLDALHGDYALTEIPLTMSDEQESDQATKQSVKFVIKDQDEPKLWIAGVEHIFQYNYNNQTTKLITQGGAHLSDKFAALAQTADGTLWAASRENGLYEIRDDTVYQTWTKENGLLDNQCNTLFVDDRGLLWVGLDHGLIVIDSKRRVIKHVLTKSDGLLSDHVNSIYVQGNDVWIGTSGGLFQLKRDRLKPLDHAANIVLSAVMVDEQDQPMDETLHLDYAQNNISFRFRAVAPASLGDLQYAYRLVGTSDQWSVVDHSKDFAYYPSLSSGHYRFEVVAINEDGTRSVEPASFEFTVRPPYWRAPWFYICLVAGSALIAYFISRSVRSQKERERELHRQLTASRLATLRMQINPHFIFNALNSIQYALFKNDTDKSMKSLEKFSGLMRHIFNYADEDRVSLRDEIAFIRNYVALEMARFVDKVTFELCIADDVDQDHIHIPPMIIQPFVENAFKHGLFHKTTPGKLSIRFVMVDDHLQVDIQDDGIGRLARSHIQYTGARSDKKSSTMVISERVDVINQSREPESGYIKVRTEDLQHGADQTGTLVIISFPIDS